MYTYLFIYIFSMYNMNATVHCLAYGGIKGPLLVLRDTAMDKHVIKREQQKASIKNCFGGKESEK